MIVTCSECDTSFNFDEQYIKETGSKVRCSKCKSVFLVYPPSVSDLHAAAPLGDDVPSAAGLDAVDLSEIDNLLDSEQKAAKADSSTEEGNDAEFGLDLDLEDVENSAGEEPKTDLDETNELDLSGLDLEEAVEAAPSPQESGDGLDFELDLTAETDSPEEAPLQADESEPSIADDELDFELDLDATSAAEDGESTESLDLELDFGDIASADDDDFQTDMEETQDLELSDMEDIVEHDQEARLQDSQAEEATDELDFDIGVADQSLDEPPAGSQEPDGAVDDFDFELDFSEEAQASTAAKKMAGSDETEELDLSELEDMLEGEEPMSDQAVDTEASDGLDFELDLDAIEEAPPAPDEAEAVPVMDETVALEVSDLEDLGQVSADESASTVEPDTGESTDELDLELDLEMDSSDDSGASSDIEDGFDLNDLDEMLGAPEGSVVDEEALESTDDFDLDLDLSEDEVETEAPSDLDPLTDLAATEESDLSDLEGMLDLDEKPIAEELASDVQELELDDVSLESAAEDAVLDHTEAFQDVELAFDDEQAPDVEAGKEGMNTIESGQEEEVADTFDMGTLTTDEQSRKESMPMAQMDIPEDTHDQMPPPKRRLSAPLRIMLVLVLIVGGGIGTLSLLDFLGLGINMKEIGRSIPVVGDLFKPKYPDRGNLKIAIIEKLVQYDIVETAAGGPLLIIKGKIRNTYDHPRSFIKITGKLYDRRKKLAGQKTVYAGNIIPNKALATMRTAAIEKKLNNRFGTRRANVKVKKGRMVPFMIVFSSLPQDLDEFTVEVAGSTKVRG